MSIHQIAAFSFHPSNKTEKTPNKCENAVPPHNQQKQKLEKALLETKLQTLMNEVTKLNREGYFNGELLVTRGTKTLCNIKSRDVKAIVTKNKAECQFPIGSVSKQFFAVALLKALYTIARGDTEAEKVATVKELLHVPLSVFLPKNLYFWEGKMPEWANTITLHQLLTHTSGLPNFTETEGHEFEKIYKSPHPHPIKKILEIISKYEPIFAPGEKGKWWYSNTNYSLIGEVIRAITNKSPAEYVTETLIRPLNLSSTYNPETGNDVELRQKNPRVASQWKYDPAKGQNRLQKADPMDDMCWPQAAGSLVSTVSDLLKWNRALHQEKSVLPAPLYDIFVKEDEAEYAYGIIRPKLYGETALFHDGRIGNYRTDLVCFPKHKISVIQFSTMASESPQIEKEAGELLAKFKDSIPNQQKREEKVKKLLEAKYPDRRLRQLKQIFRTFMTS